MIQTCTSCSTHSPMKRTAAMTADAQQSPSAPPAPVAGTPPHTASAGTTQAKISTAVHTALFDLYHGR